MSALPGSESAVFAFGPFILDRDRRLLTRDGVPITITPKAFDLLVVLVGRGGAAVSKDELMSALWPDTAVEESNLAFQVSTLRKVLGPDGGRYIATLPGRGYQFVAPLHRVEEEPAAEKPKPQRRMWIAAVAALAVIAGVIAALTLRREPPPPPRPASPAIRSLAVLPFKPLASQARDEALELGMADTLITRLSAMPGVIVRPISAVRRYSKLEDDPLAAGRALGVDAVVDGSIQRRGSRMRVTVRLLRTHDGKPLWASQLDENASDLFAVQDQVAEKLAREVAPALSPQPPRRITNDLEAYELYLQGRYHSYFKPPRAEELFRSAIERDPKFAAAWAALAELWLMRGRFGSVPPREQFEKAREAAMKAMALDPQLADAHAALGQVYADFDWDWARAEQEYRRALELNSNLAAAHGQYSGLLLARRDYDGSIEHMRRARQIDPVSPMWSIGLGAALHSAGRYEEAIAVLDKTLRVHPKLVPCLLHLGLAYTHSGRPEIGVAKFQEAIKSMGDPAPLRPLEAYAYAKAGNRDAALAIVRDIESRVGREPVNATNLAMAYAGLGDHDRAFHWLERAYQDRMYLLRMVIILPAFDPMRNDPRYVDLMKRMGL